MKSGVIFSAVGALLGIVPSSLSANSNNCLAVIRAWHSAVNCQTGEQIAELTWADGYTQWPDSGRGKWSEIKMTGPCPKYDATFRDLRVFPVKGMRQAVKLKAITRRVDLDGKFTGDYMVTKETYVCEQRNSQWRIFSMAVTQRTDLQNEALMQRYEKAR